MKKISLVAVSSIVANLFFLAVGQCCFALGTHATDGFVVLKTEAKTEFSQASSSTGVAGQSGAAGKDGRFELTNGIALIQPRQHLQVQLKNCTITANPGAALLLSMSDGVGSVTNLYENSDRSTEVKFGDCSLKLSAGKQVWFGPNEAVVAAAVKNEPGRPTLVVQHQTAGIGVIAEFTLSPATLLDISPIVQSMKESKNSAERKLYDRIIKTSAALTLMH